MKKFVNFIKGFGAAIGYFTVYIVINLLVIFIGIISIGVKAGIGAASGSLDINTVSDYITKALYGNALLFTLVGGAITLFFYWLILFFQKAPIKEKLELYPVSFKKLWPVIPLGITLHMFVSHLISLLPIPQSVLEEYSEATHILGDEMTMIQVLAVVILAPILEEVMYRGLIMKSLHRGLPMSIALIIQAIGFGLMHGQLIWICYATFFGVLLAIFKLRYQSLYPPILLHLMFNVSNFILNPFYNLVPESLASEIIIFAASTILSVLLVILIFKKTRRISSSSYPDSCNFDQPLDEGAVQTAIINKNFE